MTGVADVGAPSSIHERTQTFGRTPLCRKTCRGKWEVYGGGTSEGSGESLLPWTVKETSLSWLRWLRVYLEGLVPQRKEDGDPRVKTGVYPVGPSLH